MIKTRRERVRKVLKSRSNRLRLSVFVSNRHIYAQIIDDQKGVTIASANDTKTSAKGKGVEVAKKVGEFLAKQAIQVKVKNVKFDRGSKKYHGRIKALAEGAREGGLNF